MFSCLFQFAPRYEKAVQAGDNPNTLKLSPLETISLEIDEKDHVRITPRDTTTRDVTPRETTNRDVAPRDRDVTQRDRDVTANLQLSTIETFSLENDVIVGNKGQNGGQRSAVLQDTLTLSVMETVCIDVEEDVVMKPSPVVMATPSPAGDRRSPALRGVVAMDAVSSGDESEDRRGIVWSPMEKASAQDERLVGRGAQPTYAKTVHERVPQYAEERRAISTVHEEVPGYPSQVVPGYHPQYSEGRVPAQHIQPEHYMIHGTHAPLSGSTREPTHDAYSHPLEGVSRYRDPQLQEGENYLHYSERDEVPLVKISLPESPESPEVEVVKPAKSRSFMHGLSSVFMPLMRHRKSKLDLREPLVRVSQPEKTLVNRGVQVSTKPKKIPATSPEDTVVPLSWKPMLMTESTQTQATEESGSEPRPPVEMVNKGVQARQKEEQPAPDEGHMKDSVMNQLQNVKVVETSDAWVEAETDKINKAVQVRGFTKTAKDTQTNTETLLISSTKATIPTQTVTDSESKICSSKHTQTYMGSKTKSTGSQYSLSPSMEARRTLTRVLPGVVEKKHQATQANPYSSSPSMEARKKLPKITSDVTDQRSHDHDVTAQGSRAHDVTVQETRDFADQGVQTSLESPKETRNKTEKPNQRVDEALCESKNDPNELDRAISEFEKEFQGVNQTSKPPPPLGNSPTERELSLAEFMEIKPRTEIKQQTNPESALPMVDQTTKSPGLLSGGGIWGPYDVGQNSSITSLIDKIQQSRVDGAGSRNIVSVPKSKPQRDNRYAYTSAPVYEPPCKIVDAK